MLEAPQSIMMVMESVFPSPGGGGAESQVRTLGIEFQARGHELQLIVPMVATGPQVAREHSDGLDVTRIPYPKIPLVGALWMLWGLARILIHRRHEYAVIHAHIAGNMAALCAVLGHCLGKPVVVKLTGMTEIKGGILDPSPRLAVRLRRHWLKSASQYQATSQRIATQLVARGFAAHKVLLLANAVDIRRFAKIERDLALRERVCPDKELVAIYVGRLEPEKGLELLVSAWATQFKHRSDVALVLVGSGSQQAALEHQCAQLSVTEQVVFVGPTAQVERYLSIADVGLLASQFEGLSNALLEYMAAGLPVVGSAVSGTEDWVINGQTGWLFAPGDHAGLTHALSELSRAGEQERRRLGQCARERVVAVASVEAVVSTLSSLYGRLGEERASARSVLRPGS